jgi:hypothetical protein
VVNSWNGQHRTLGLTRDVEVFLEGPFVLSRVKGEDWGRKKDQTECRLVYPKRTMASSMISSACLIWRESGVGVGL